MDMKASDFTVEGQPNKERRNKFSLRVGLATLGTPGNQKRHPNIVPENSIELDDHL